MNNRIITFAFFFSFSIGCNFLIAQSYLSFGSSGVQHEDTLHIGDSIHFSFWLVNQGNVPVNDSLQVLCETFDIIGSPISSMSIGGAYNVASSLDVGDSILINITELVTVSSYVIGDNIIVIWPASIFPGSVDTSFTPIHILNSITTGLELGVLRDEMVVSPNPTNDYLILSNNLGSLMKGITVFDDQGKILYVNENDFISPFYFDLNAFNSGVYFVSTIINDQRIVKRFILVK